MFISQLDMSVSVCRSMYVCVSVGVSELTSQEFCQKVLASVVDSDASRWFPWQHLAAALTEGSSQVGK